MKKPSFHQLLGIGVWVISFVLGVVLTLVLVWVLFNTTIERYGTNYFAITVGSIMFLLVIWLDYLLDTKLLPD